MKSFIIDSIYNIILNYINNEEIYSKLDIRFVDNNSQKTVAGYNGNNFYLRFNLRKLDFSEGEIIRIYEYSHINNDPVIGQCFVQTPVLKALQAVCHEVAHLYEFYDRQIYNLPRENHGELFQKHYYNIRTKFFNPLLEDQNDLKEKYYNQIKDRIKSHYGYNISLDYIKQFDISR